MSADEVLGLVFDLPESEWAREIRRLRSIYDPARARFPVEVTVAGSSGLGCVAPGQAFKVIAKHVQAIARNVSPFACAFSHVEVFPQSGVYYLAVVDEEPFHSFQRALAASPLRFEATEFSYKPHCTIAALPGGAPAAAQAAFASFPIPAGEVTISSISLYAVNASANACRRISRLSLGA